jgi:hypothetical protein
MLKAAAASAAQRATSAEGGGAARSCCRCCLSAAPAAPVESRSCSTPILSGCKGVKAALSAEKGGLDQLLSRDGPSDAPLTGVKC